MMASITSRPNGHRWIQWKSPSGSRKTLRLGKIPLRVAEQHQRYIERILVSNTVGMALEQEILKFLANLPEVILERYANCGLIQATPNKIKSITLDQYLHSYFNARRSDVAVSTWIFYEHTRKRLVEFFGPDRRLDAIQPANARDFKSWLETTNKRDKPQGTKPIRGLSVNTVRRRLGLCKQVFRQAVEDGLIVRNPFQAFRVSVRSNKERQHYVDLGDFMQVVDRAPDAYWKSLLLLGRIAGLRIPSEAAGLKWEHIDWKNHRLRIVDSKKTQQHIHRHLRMVPIPTILREQLRELQRQAEPGAIYVFPHVGTSASLRNAMLRFLKAAGLNPWDKLWQNLRASAATDYARQLPAHVAAAICGHTTQIAREHYWTVADSDLERAMQMLDAMATVSTATANEVTNQN